MCKLYVVARVCENNCYQSCNGNIKWYTLFTFCIKKIKICMPTVSVVKAIAYDLYGLYFVYREYPPPLFSLKTTALFAAYII